jgi:hypothetical protein
MEHDEHSLGEDRRPVLAASDGARQDQNEPHRAPIGQNPALRMRRGGGPCRSDTLNWAAHYHLSAPVRIRKAEELAGWERNLHISWAGRTNRDWTTVYIKAHQ